MEKIYFKYQGKIVCGAVEEKKSDGLVVAVGNELLWVPITETYFKSLNDLLAYEAGAFLTPQ